MTRRTERSRRVFEEGRRYLPGGVNSPVRSFRAVGGDAVVVASGAGSRIRDVDGNEYVDYCASWGPLILGHAHPAVVEAVQAAAKDGLSFGAATEREVELARLVCESVPSIEMVRFVSSGTEATMSAIRLARAYTGRSKVVKFEGCYHGHADGLLVQAGSGVATLALPDSAGVPASYAAETLVAPYNDFEAVQGLFQRWGNQIACVIVEPLAANMGVVPPAPGFLELLRVLCSDSGALLVFDEVITGFRVGLGGYQAMCGVMPDLTCLGKVVGGGMPVGAYGGRREIMEMVAPLGPMYQAGTLSGNPLAMAAGIATLRELSRPGFYEEIEAKAERLARGIKAAVARLEVPATLNAVGSMLTVFFTPTPVTDYASARKADTQRFARFFHALLDAGVYFPPSQFEAAFVSAAHSDADIDATVGAIESALSASA
ncbi:MAG TPA: glutamate-1-semialdehyde 2,1-aminomutase [Dehalococcoidia bacterium]|nr:glutamate-1-semialdehyde 2,1-aminomutase [Dehalococcoidia bacterium]